MISQPLSWYLRGGLALVGGARRQVLHRLPRHSRYAGDVCSTELWLPWCRAWTCCIGCCARNALLPSLTELLRLQVSSSLAPCELECPSHTQSCSYSSLISCSIRQSSSGLACRLGHSGLLSALHLDSCHLRCRTSRTMSYVMHVRHRTCDVRHRVEHRTYDVVRAIYRM